LRNAPVSLCQVPVHGLPIAKSLVDLHGGTFTLKSKLRIGTEVVVTFPPERVVAAMAPLSEHAPSIVSDSEQEPGPEEEPLQARLFRAGT
jgi:two-component system cell cycle sensor histidine kinase PleC